MWAGFFKNEFCVEDGVLVIKANYKDEVFFSIPNIDKAPPDFLKSLEEFSIDNYGDFILYPVEERQIKTIEEKLGKKTNSRIVEDWFDYLYKIDDLINLSGKKYHGHKNHVNKFLATFPSYEIVKIDRSVASELVEFLNSIADPEDSSLAAYENGVVKKLLEIYSEDYLEGIALKIEGKYAGFTIGEIKDATLYSHIEKADRNVPGSYSFLTNSYVKYIKEKYPLVEFVNREEDVGDLGLRRSKESYHPVELLYKYRLELRLNV